MPAETAYRCSCAFTLDSELMVSLVRSAELDDATAIARVHVATWRSAYRGLLPDEFLASLSQSHYEERWRRSLHDN